MRVDATMRLAAILVVAAVWGATPRAHAQARPATPAPAASAPTVPADTNILLPQEMDSIHVGQTRRGRLEAGDWTMGDGTYADVWYVRGQVGQRITITLRSRDFDAYLQLLDASGARLADDDDSGGGQGAARITFVLRSNERYQIVVNNFGDEPDAGVYTLEIR